MNKLQSYIDKVSPATRYALADQVWVSGCNFLQGVLLARFLGLEAFGTFALAWMFVLLGSSLQQAFISAPMMSIFPQQTEEDQIPYLNATWILQVGMTTVLGMCAWVGFPLLDRVNENLTLAFLVPALPIALVAFVMQEYWRRYFFIRQKARHALILDLVSYGCMIIGIILGGLTGHLSLGSSIWIIAGSFGIGATGAWIWERPAWVSRSILSSAWLLHWRFSKWLIGKSVMQFFSSNYFILAAGAILGPAALGAIRVVQQLMGLTHILFLAMENIVPVKAATAYARDGITGMAQYLKAVSIKSGLVIAALLALVALLASPILHYLYGEEYAGYSYLLISWCILYLIIFPGYPLRFALRTLEQTRPIFIAYSLSTAFSLLAASVFVGKWGLIGVVAGMSVAQLIMQACYLVSIRRQIRIPDSTPNLDMKNP